MTRIWRWFKRHEATLWACFLTAAVTFTVTIFATQSIYSAKIRNDSIERTCEGVDGRDYAGCIEKAERRWGVR